MTLNEPDQEEKAQQMTECDAQPGSVPGATGRDLPEPVDQIRWARGFIQHAYGEPEPLDDQELRRDPACGS